MASSKTNDKPVTADDQTFLDRLQTYQMKLSEFDHLAQLRAIWFLLTRDGWTNGVAQVRYWFERYFSHMAASRQYHATAVDFWCRAVWTAIESDHIPKARDFASFIRQHGSHLGPDRINEFYSPDVLCLDAARQRPLPPDLNQFTMLAVPYQQKPSEPASAEEPAPPEKAAEGKKPKS